MVAGFFKQINFGLLIKFFLYKSEINLLKVKNVKC